MSERACEHCGGPISNEKHATARCCSRQCATMRWRAVNPDRVHRSNRRGYLKKKYGLTLEDYDEMLGQQGGSCAICKGSPNGRGPKYFHVDHDSRTDAVRGLLCFNCNSSLGGFQHSLGILESAVKYLIKHKENKNGE